MDMLPGRTTAGMRAVIVVALTAVGALTGAVTIKMASGWTTEPPASDDARASAVASARSDPALASRLRDEAMTQSALRAAFAAQKTVYLDAQRYVSPTTDLNGNGVPDLSEAHPSLMFVEGMMPTHPGPVFVTTNGSVLYLSARSPAGRCFYLLDDASGPTRFAADARCRDVSAQAWSPMAWERPYR